MYLAALAGAKKIRLINLQNRLGKMSTSASTDIDRKLNCFYLKLLNYNSNLIEIMPFIFKLFSNCRRGCWFFLIWGRFRRWRRRRVLFFYLIIVKRWGKRRGRKEIQRHRWRWLGWIRSQIFRMSLESIRKQFKRKIRRRLQVENAFSRNWFWNGWGFPIWSSW